ncbi:BQ5605_C024g09930 [Microbotryum silenes-dioicae]|uniref:BQ5605_C024g09930 protein n=1 Tax=Microbotryum silenes-dioicae TaxID=796604 RepID=A0A2X0PMB3_9BASI|nr:BQ5605_C024g09930 [Microbotryum silenes-dioicae]
MPGLEKDEEQGHGLHDAGVDPELGMIPGPIPTSTTTTASTTPPPSNKRPFGWGVSSRPASGATSLLPQTRSPTRASFPGSRLSWLDGAGKKSFKARFLFVCTAAWVLWQLVVGIPDSASRRARTRAITKRALIGFESIERRRQVLPKDIAGERTWWPIEDLLEHSLLAKHPSPNCNLNIYQKDRYAPLLSRYRYRGPHFYHNNTDWTVVPHYLPRKKNTYFIAINLINSDYVLPALIRVFYTVLSALGPSRFHVSIYENGSTDTTPAQLYLFAMVLDRLGAGYTLHSDAAKAGFPAGARIKSLANLRNKALQPLLDAPKGTFDRVLFINDVHLCESDLFELMLQHEVQGADMSCGMDYKSLEIKEFAPNYPVIFYDVWVARDMLGLPFYNISYPSGAWDLPGGARPMPLSPDRFRLYDLQPVQVFSCWNGVTIIDADLFVNPKHALRFRDDGDTDRQSECYLFCSDLWKTYSPFSSDGNPQDGGRGARIQVVPRTVAAYQHYEYGQVRQDKNTTAFEQEGWLRDKNNLDELIEWKRYPPRLINTYEYAVWSNMNMSVLLQHVVTLSAAPTPFHEKNGLLSTPSPRRMSILLQKTTASDPGSDGRSTTLSAPERRLFSIEGTI